MILHADNGREWSRWLAVSGATNILASGRQHFLSDAHLASEAAIHGNGVALGDTVTIDQPLAAGRLIVPIDLAVPASDSFYLVCRNEVRETSVVRAFIEWLQSEIGDTRLARISRANVHD